ncbi:MAG: hypothetical protein Q9195_006946 [Heterodermia aff. obscurata]
MSHEWPSFRESSEPLSPTSTGNENRGASGLQNATSSSDIGAAAYATFSSITWPSNISLARPHGLPNPLSHVSADLGASPASRSPEIESPGLRAPEQIARGSPRQGFALPSAPTSATGPAGLKEEDEEVMSASDLDEIAEDETLPQTAAERRAAKRKMKRFRWVHRLQRTGGKVLMLVKLDTQSNAIPPERAKLKRLSVDDRERMMRSRALPEHFDRSSALHAGLPATPPILGNVLSPSYGSLAMGNQPGGFLRSRSFPAIYQPQPPPMGQYPQEHMSRIRTGSLASPATADLDHSAAGPLVFGRSCPPATFDYSHTSQMGVPFQHQGVYDSTQATFAIPPSPNVLQHPQPQNQEAYHQNRVMQQASPPVPQHEFTRPALPEQRMRAAYTAYPTDYPIQSDFNTASPQMANSEGTSYQVTRASISGPQTQRDISPEGGVGPDIQQPQLRVKTGRRRSFTHPPDHSFPR